jgi:adenine-specific DNA-methyltransferase
VLAQALLERTEQRRQLIASSLDPSQRSRLGQIFTPSAVGDFLAGLLDLPRHGRFTILDPGAGIGSLSVSIVARVMRERPGLDLNLVCFELDEALVPHLEETLAETREVASQAGVTVTPHIRSGDFLVWASEVAAGDAARETPRLDGCVMNPPYRKINIGDAERRAADRIGLRVTNLYPAFLALAAAVLEPGGQLVAITPRSFANGTYFKPFREFFLSHMALDRIHVYESRGHVFRDSDVLQENVVFSATRSGRRDKVVLSVSAIQGDGNPTLREVPYAEVVHPGDPEVFVRIPIDAADTHVAARVAALPAALADLGVEVSTGRVVDFRVKEHLCMSPSNGTVPLIYPGHLRGFGLRWPVENSKKPNALAVSTKTSALLLPNETYVLVKRFSAKEERRRLVAALTSSDQIPGDRVGFENHLNVYHRQNRGIDRSLALGLVTFLNCTLMDLYVRQFSGHTQINAGDLRSLRYPPLAELCALGSEVEHGGWPAAQEHLDALVARHVTAFGEPEPLRDVA